jgi:hypoxanthine phosphoribosyltransferase
MIEKELTKIWVSYKDIHDLVKEGCERLSKIYSPDFLVGISGGGLMPVRLAKTFFKYYTKKDIPIYVIGISNYDSNNNLLPEPKITQGLDEIVIKSIIGKKGLIVDEVDDTRKTLEKACNYLLNIKIKELKILVMHSKKKEKIGKIPECIQLYYVREVDDVWINYQWDFKEIINK